MRGFAEKHFGRFHQCFGERRMRMNRELQIARRRAHLNCEHAFRNQLAGVGADEANAQNHLGVGIQQELGEPVSPIERNRAA